ncbi:MAG: SDR family oxidoreductase [Patescibacteria group bacterium]|nr:SDR family oxidoreductase [Patescibacteria group bacterium]
MLERRVAIVTSAASGIGKATAEKLARDSKYTVYAADRDPNIHTVFDYSNIKPVEIDIGNYDQARSMVSKAAQESGRLDILVNAAGIMPKGRKSTFWNKDGTPTKEFEEMEIVNLGAPIVIMVEASKVMHDTGGGTVINVTSAKRYWPDLHHGHYQDVKSRLSKVTRKVAKLFREQHNIRLVDIQPGNTKTRIDRGVWTTGNNIDEIKAAEKITSWWRNTFGTSPERVAEAIYEVAEGRNKNNIVRVGLDSHIGRILYLVTFPFYPYRFDILFGVGSIAIYESAKWAKILHDQFQRLRANHDSSI